MRWKIFEKTFSKCARHKNMVQWWCYLHLFQGFQWAEVCIRALGECSPEEREKDYPCEICDKTFQCHDRLVQHIRNVHKMRAMLRNALCPHCKKRIMTKCGHSNHIWIKHPEFREAAEMTLNDKGHGKLIASLKNLFEMGGWWLPHTNIVYTYAKTC